jgi:hypothetical protein
MLRKLKYIIFFQQEGRIFVPLSNFHNALIKTRTFSKYILIKIIFSQFLMELIVLLITLTTL